MPVLLNLRQLAETTLHVQGELAVEELDWGGPDDLVALTSPLRYAFHAHQEGEILLLHGALQVELSCQCARCLRVFRRALVLAPWTAEIPLAGPEALPVLGDLVDLTQRLREDTVLALPQHPHCEPVCGGEAAGPVLPAETSTPLAADRTTDWSALDRLKL